jgi:RNA polymerase-interacting CarD/CdnL/TRCF family regulator
MKQAQTKAYNRNQKKKANDDPKPTIIKKIDDASDNTLVNEMWDDLKQRIKSNPEFADLSDPKKVEIYQKTKFKDFYNTHPIVSRYLVCMGQFSNVAFKKYIKKINMSKLKIRFMNKEEKMDVYINNQAFYVKQLWIAYQRQHYSQKDATNIYKHAVTTLKKEFLDFEQLQKDTEKKLKREEKLNKADMVRELTRRVTNEEQSLNENSVNGLLQKLQVQISKQRWNNMLTQIKSEVEYIPPSIIARGKIKPKNE